MRANLSVLRSRLEMLSYRSWNNSRTNFTTSNCNPLVVEADDRQYRALVSEYEGLDPGHGKRKRKAIAKKLHDVLEEFEAKADQIYALYDVFEGARLDNKGNLSRCWLEL